jgi:hypothetical protein
MDVFFEQVFFGFCSFKHIWPEVGCGWGVFLVVGPVCGLFLDSEVDFPVCM